MHVLHHFPLFVLVILLGVIVLPIYSQPEDIAQMTAEKYLLEYDDKEFIIYYGYAGSFEIEIEKNVQHPKVLSMDINPEKKSLEIIFEKTPEISLIWFRLPTEVISAEGDQFLLLVNGVETKYDLVDYQTNIRIGFIIDEGTEKVEIIGTKVIPEFEGLLVFSLAIFGTLIIMKKKFFDHQYHGIVNSI